MKKNILFLITVLFILVQSPIVAKAALSADDQASVAFYQQQAQERALFIQQHPDIIAKQDAEGKALMAQKEAIRLAQKNGGVLPANIPQLPPSTLSAQDKSTLSAFIEKQKGDKDAFVGSHRQGGASSNTLP